MLQLQVPTVRNVNLKYGSLAAFFAHLDADIVCMQVSSSSSRLLEVQQVQAVTPYPHQNYALNKLCTGGEAA